VRAPTWRPALLGTAHDDRVRCDLCPHGCDLGDGQTGLCRVRRNQHGVLETATFAVSVTHLDAIERKPLYHMRPGSRVLTTAAPGCTFRCDYCINHRLSQYGRTDDSKWVGEAADPVALVARAAAAGAAVGLSYTEPGLAPELTLALAEQAVPLGVPVVWKSNGFLTPSAVDLVTPVIDAVNIDVKAASDAAHRRLTGAPVRPVLEAVERFRAAGVWVEISTPLIPGTSAHPDQLLAIARELAAIDPAMPWHLLRFTPDFRMADRDPTLPDALAEAVEIGHLAGLQFVYVERALGTTGRTTHCPGCDAALIERDVWEMTKNSIVSGTCPNCARPVPGRWE
jgi:pyruvate formate lyase activating enzyme